MPEVPQTNFVLASAVTSVIGTSVKGEAFDTPDLKHMPAPKFVNNPVDLLIFDNAGTFVRPYNQTALCFRAYQTPRCIIKTSSQNITTENILKIHLDDPTPIPRGRTPDIMIMREDKYTRNTEGKWVHPRLKPKTEEEVFLIQKAAKYLVTKYALFQTSTLIHWEQRILGSAEILMSHSAELDTPIVGIFPKSSLFLKKIVGALGAQAISSVEIGDNTFTTEGLTLPKIAFLKKFELSVIVITPEMINAKKEEFQTFVIAERTRLQKKHAALLEMANSVREIKDLLTSELAAFPNIEQQLLKDINN